MERSAIRERSRPRVGWSRVVPLGSASALWWHPLAATQSGPRQFGETAAPKGGVWVSGLLVVQSQHDRRRCHARFREHLWPIGFCLAPTARLGLAATVRRIRSATAPPDFLAATCRLASAVASARWTRIRRSWRSAISLVISSTLWSKAW